jgi:hypothetical protein
MSILSRLHPILLIPPTFLLDLLPVQGPKAPSESSLNRIQGGAEHRQKNAMRYSTPRSPNFTVE